jgi:hypothetical protein
MEDIMVAWKSLILAGAVAGSLSIAALVSGAAEEEGQDPVALSKALVEASVPLEQGLQASAREGRPISAKYEIEGGKLQLSVYTAKPDGFAEVIIDHKTGAVAKAEPITDDEDLDAARAESQAMTTATSSLDRAAAAAVVANSGYRVVSIIPVLSSGHPIAEIMLMRGADVKKFQAKLD